jgi:hypothetical protein
VRPTARADDQTRGGQGGKIDFSAETEIAPANWLIGRLDREDLGSGASGDCLDESVALVFVSALPVFYLPDYLRFAHRVPEFASAG